MGIEDRYSENSQKAREEGAEFFKSKTGQYMLFGSLGLLAVYFLFQFVVGLF